MGSSQSSYATTNNDINSSITKKNWSSKSRSVRGRKSINNNTKNNNNKTIGNHGSAPHGLRASIVSMPSESMVDHRILDVTSAESVHSDDVVDMYQQLEDLCNVGALMNTDEDDTVSSVEEEEDFDDDERLQILEDVRQLKTMATFFKHPEAPVKLSGIECARCYFDRCSYPFETASDANERDMILADAAALKQSVIQYLHPEILVKATDPCVFGRNYFSRYSAPIQDFCEEDRISIMADASKLKESAMHFLHSETPMLSSVACARNYFTRPSGPEQDDDPEIRTEMLDDASNLRKVAIDYLHPEIQMTSKDATCFGRNYFMRPSALLQDSTEEVTERDAIYNEIKLLRQAAKHCLHPELPVTVTDPTVFGRNYFGRASAPARESLEDMKICQQILEDTNAFHQLAVEYLHPELPLIIYATATGRNYFTRGSGLKYESLEDQKIRVEVMDELKSFKQLARDYLHPELPVVVYGTSTGRNYYTRPDAEISECVEDLEERELIVADVNALKQSALHFLHPERPVVTSDGTVCGRNYFSRFSAFEYDAQPERDLILKDMKVLRQRAIDFLHPEIPLVSSIGCARNYFSRASAEEYEDRTEVAERELCLADARALKKLAVDFMHPELPVVTTDETACGRNYFNRFAAGELLEAEMYDEYLEILADAAALKKFALDYLHPERRVQSCVPCTRNYFDRPSSKIHDAMIHTFPAHREDYDDNSDHHNEHIDHFGLMDEELELYHDLRTELEAFPVMDSSSNRSATLKYGTTINKADSEVGSNLSRSPSSVFLFGMDDAEYE